jgi:hypothetical protein
MTVAPLQGLASPHTWFVQTVSGLSSNCFVTCTLYMTFATPDASDLLNYAGGPILSALVAYPQEVCVDPINCGTVTWNYSLVSGSIAPVPLPATLPLLASGLGVSLAGARSESLIPHSCVTCADSGEQSPNGTTCQTCSGVASLPASSSPIPVCRMGLVMLADWRHGVAHPNDTRGIAPQVFITDMRRAKPRGSGASNSTSDRAAMGRSTATSRL